MDTELGLRTIEESLTCVRSFEADRQHYGFVAENNDEGFLSFVARLPESFPRSGRFGDFDVRRVTFSIEPGPDSSADLVLRQVPLLMDMDIDEKEHPIVLAKNVKKFEMEFWDTRGSQWLDEWTLTNALPAMVKVTLEFGDDSGSRMHQEVTRVIAIPALIVPAAWQGRQGAGARGQSNFRTDNPNTGLK